MKWALTHVWEIDGYLIIAGTIEQSIEIFRSFLRDDNYQPHSIKQIRDSNYGSYDALKEKV